jgi:hypothetical protein
MKLLAALSLTLNHELQPYQQSTNAKIRFITNSWHSFAPTLTILKSSVFFGYLTTSFQRIKGIALDTTKIDESLGFGRSGRGLMEIPSRNLSGGNEANIRGNLIEDG